MRCLHEGHSRLLLMLLLLYYWMFGLLLLYSLCEKEEEEEGEENNNNINNHLLCPSCRHLIRLTKDSHTRKNCYCCCLKHQCHTMLQIPLRDLHLYKLMLMYLRIENFIECLLFL